MQNFLSSPNQQSYSVGGKPHTIRRGPGRPRKDFTPTSKLFRDNKIKKFRSSVGSNGNISNVVNSVTTTVSSLTGGNSGLVNALKNITKRRVMNRDELMQQFTNSNSLPNPITENNIGFPVKPQSPPPPPPTSDDFGTNMLDQDNGDKLMQPPEEPPYFPERWTGKLCALCNLGERSQLGQGEMLRIEVKSGDLSNKTTVTPLTSPLGDSSDDKSPKILPLSNRRQKGLHKCKYV